MKTSSKTDREGWDRASPISHVREDAPPTLLLQGDLDSLVWVEEARAFATALRSVSDQVVAYGELPGAQHAYEVFHSVRTEHTINAVTAFLEWCHARSQVEGSG